MAIDHTTIDTDSTSPYRYQQFVAQNGDAKLTLPLTVGWASDSRDSVLYLNKGTLQRANIEVAAPPGDLKFYRMTYSFQKYMPLSKDFTLYLSGEAGYGNGFGDTDDLPFYKNFFAGGMGTVRGYETASLGPLDTVCDNYVTRTNCRLSEDRIGGNRKINGTVEVLFRCRASGRTSLFAWGLPRCRSGLGQEQQGAESGYRPHPHEYGSFGALEFPDGSAKIQPGGTHQQAGR